MRPGVSDKPATQREVWVWGPPCCYSKQEAPPMGKSTLHCICGATVSINRTKSTIEVQVRTGKRRSVEGRNEGNGVGGNGVGSGGEGERQRIPGEGGEGRGTNGADL